MSSFKKETERRKPGGSAGTTCSITTPCTLARISTPEATAVAPPLAA
eukprot:CAMPEP_0170323208 /NCGR_PEP_ID=MMETSP0116_2-20130129/62399_1 /TAXON_ID=400756 /ORGANISM="Durinskia baltica, Strain CSIRO CS-38" /LENGTH=46 /DNA_ID= /DNA_START= /DNA_END= /DNA_ORIENTATION=